MSTSDGDAPEVPTVGGGDTVRLHNRRRRAAQLVQGDAVFEGIDFCLFEEELASEAGD
jgi:hypothetical protein